MGLHWKLNVVMLGTRHIGNIKVFGRRSLSRLALSCFKCDKKKSSPGKAHQLVIQYRMINPEITHMSDIIQTKQVIFRSKCI